MKLAYLINTYPQASVVFIRREMQAVERLDHDLHRFALRADPRWMVDPAAHAEGARTEHLLKHGLMRLVPSALGWMLTRPRRTWAALRLAWAAGRRGSGGGVSGTGGRLRHIAYLIEGAHLARRCKDLGITHLHAHFGTNSSTVALLCHALGGPPYSFTVHGPEEFDAPVALSLPEKIRHARHVIAISSFGRSQLCRWADPADWPKLQVVHCGIEPWQFPPPAPTPTGPGPRLVAIGRLVEQKGFALLIEAIARAAPDLPGLHLTLIGDGALRPQIEARVAELGLGAQITLAGWQSEEGVRAALAQAQALILPSFAEGLPVVIMEAMAAGRPVIATAIAGIPELVTPETGWLVPAGDAGALSAAIVQLARLPPADLDRMGAAARLRVMDRHDIDDQAARLMQLIGAGSRTAQPQSRTAPARYDGQSAQSEPGPA